MRYVLLFIVALQSHAQISDFDHIDFKKADSIALACKNEGLDNLPQLTQRLTSSLNTEVEQFRSIYKWVCSNIANDYDLYSRNKRKRNKFNNDSLKLKAWNDRFKKVIFNKLLKKQRTICTGYAYLVKELSDLANLDCKIVHGYGRTSMTTIEAEDSPNHSWNAIKLNGTWYLCDPTWASGIPDPETNIFTFRYNDGYFLTHPELFAINHFPLEKKWSLLNDIVSFDTFLDAPILYGNAYNNLKFHLAPKTLTNDVNISQTITFQYELLKKVIPEDIHLDIDNGYHSKRLQPKDVSIENHSLSFTHRFTQSGFYDVHFSIDDKLISTYTFNVSR